ncbi:MAG: hypothetical protein NVS3B12_27750 [Acidimicrobiales bacterium]
MTYEWEARTDRIPYVPATQPQRQAKTTNVAAIIAITCAALGLLVIPVLMGPAAVIAGVVGLTMARTRNLTGATLSGVAAVAGMVEIVHTVQLVMAALS